MPLTMSCPECGGPSIYAGTDDRGTLYTCESSDRDCVVFDHWADDIRTYRSTYRGDYQAIDDDD
jgi:hypothetical protein